MGCGNRRRRRKAVATHGIIGMGRMIQHAGRDAGATKEDRTLDERGCSVEM